MHVLVVETVPSAPLRALTVAFHVHFAVIDRRVMLARDKEDLLGLGAVQHLVQCVVFSGLRRVAEVACVNDEVGFLWQSVDFVDGGLQSGGYIGIRRLVEAHVTVADLDEVEFSLRSRLPVLAERLR